MLITKVRLVISSLISKMNEYAKMSLKLYMATVLVRSLVVFKGYPQKY